MNLVTFHNISFYRCDFYGLSFISLVLLAEVEPNVIANHLKMKKKIIVCLTLILKL